MKQSQGQPLLSEELLREELLREVPLKEGSESMSGQVWEEYQAGMRFKAGLGSRGMYEQGRLNERFFVGDQWHGARCGNDRPLVRHNVIKRIGDYKMALVGSNPVSVSYSADGVPDTVALREQVAPLRKKLAAGEDILLPGTLSEESLSKEREIGLVMGALSDYFRVTAERVKLEDLREQALRNAYISGTGIVYTWWDDRVPTGLYADEGQTVPVRGDVACEVLDIENVYFGDPNMDNIQEQPYILIAQRRSVADLRREARRNGRPEYEVRQILPDRDNGDTGGGHAGEPSESDKATVLTKFWKEWNADGTEFTIRAVRTCRDAVVRPPWDLGIRLYPFARFAWERRRDSAYGESEVTYLIPNQIAINRMITASVWAVMMMGMPMMLVNTDLITTDITNDPGQIIPVCGSPEETAGAIRYIDPPKLSDALDGNVASLISNTLRQSGANDVVLGDVRPDNTSAIMAVRETATLPLLQVQNRYYSFCEDIARIWAEFWVTHYGQRQLKIRDELGTWYLPFDGERYRRLLISTRVDVGAAALWNEEQSVRTLDSLFDRGVIDEVQYLTRLPKGAVPDVSRLVTDIRRAAEDAAADE